MTDKTVAISRVINSPIERVWQAWTSPNDLKHWFAVDGRETKVLQYDLKTGGKARLKFPGAAGEYTWKFVKVVKPTKLVIDILDFSLPQYPQGVGGICNIGLKDLQGKTEVTVAGELPNESMRKMTERGWGATLDKLNYYLKEE
jgi:uncharacterized protein YndB with AHSA1/START domain